MRWCRQLQRRQQLQFWRLGQHGRRCCLQQRLVPALCRNTSSSRCCLFPACNRQHRRCNCSSSSPQRLQPFNQHQWVKSRSQRWLHLQLRRSLLCPTVLVTAVPWQLSSCWPCSISSCRKASKDSRHSSWRHSCSSRCRICCSSRRLPAGASSSSCSRCGRQQQLTFS